MSNRKPTKKEQCTAYHEAAHAVVLYRTAGHAGGDVTIVPRQIEGGRLLGAAYDYLSDSFSSKDMEGTILSNYAGGHAQRKIDPTSGTKGCDKDDADADELLHLHDWKHREQELRQRSLELTRQHWAEIAAVADELLRLKALDDTEVEALCDAAAGDSEALPQLAQYRHLRGDYFELRKRGTCYD